MPTCANMCYSVATWTNIAVCQLCRERQPFWNHDGLNLTCLDQCHCVGSPKKHLCGHRHWSRRLPPEQRSGLYPPDRAPPFVWTTFFLGGSLVSWSAQADHCGMITCERFVPTPHAPCCQESGSRSTWEALALGDNSRCLFTIYNTKLMYAGLPVDIRVFLPLRKQQPRFAQGQPKKELRRTTKAIAQMNADWKGKKAQYAGFNVPTCGEIAVWQLCRETACVEQSWWPEFKMFGSMPWCWFPWHKLLRRLAQKNCYKIHSLNLIDEFTSLFSPKMIVAVLPRKAFPRKQAFVDITIFLCFSK